MNRPQISWWGWVIAAWFLLTVVSQQRVSLFALIVAGFVVSRLIGLGRSGGDQPRPPGRPVEGSGREPAPDVLPPLPGARAQREPQPGAPPSPWRTVPGGSAPEDRPMPRIDVPRYPVGGERPPTAGGTAYPGQAPPGTGPVSGPADPVVSLAQLDLARYARDLHGAASAGSGTEVRRLLAEVEQLAARTSRSVGREHRAFSTGLRRLAREAGAATQEQPAGARVAQVVRGAGALGQTGRYE